MGHKQFLTMKSNDYDLYAFAHGNMKDFDKYKNRQDQNGEIISFSLYAPMDWKYFIKLSIYSQKQYIMHLNDTYYINMSMLSKMFNKNYDFVGNYCRNILNIRFKDLTKYKTNNNPKIEDWIKFLKGEYIMNDELLKKQLSNENKRKLRKYIDDLEEQLNKQNDVEKKDIKSKENDNIEIINGKKYYITKFGKVIEIENDNNFVNIVEDDKENKFDEIYKAGKEKYKEMMKNNYSSAGYINFKGNIDDIYYALNKLNELLNKDNVRLQVNISWE